jgi:hypothetical protein
MTVPARLSPYETLTAMRPRLLEQPPDIGAVSLLGQAVSDVLDDDKSESAILQLIADLESARSSATVADINKRWALPLVALLGLLRQHLHNRAVEDAANDPSSITLRDKVLAALDAGIDTPTAIGEFVHSPTTVVSRVLRQLAQQGRVERAEGSEDRRRRPYRRVVTDSVEQSELDDPAGESPRTRGIADIAGLVDFAERQARCNVKMASELLPNLTAAGSNTHLSPDLRVSALGVAGVIVRGVGGPNAGDDALDLAETAYIIAERSGDKLLLARAAYDRARAVLFGTPNEVDTALQDLQQAEECAERDSSSAGQLQLGWCAYTRGLIEEGSDLRCAAEHLEHALSLFRQADFDYGAAAALTLLTRVSYTDGARGSAANHAQEALSIATSHGYLQLMGESSFWAAELLSEYDPQRAKDLFGTASELFAAVGSRHWHALSCASREVATVRGDQKFLRKNAEELLDQLRDLHGEFPVQDMSWAAAVLNRWIGVLARYAHQYEVAEEYLDTSAKQYAGAAFAPGLAVATVGLMATKREHFEIESEDLAKAAEDFASAPAAARGALERLEDGTLVELGTI